MQVCKLFRNFALKINLTMRKIVFPILLAMCVGIAQAQQNPTYLNYIAEWRDVAVANQRDYGIPASIILAQGLLESGAGTSELAQNAHNHFGIKCTNDWMGGNYYYDDDAKGECFRVYNDAGESYKDHSLFLQRPRYQTCFEIAVEDYSGWAYRLKQCGYATDPLYPKKLIKLIEDYRLDTIATPEALASAGSASTSGKKPAGSTTKKATVVSQTEPIAYISSDPEPEYVEPLSAYQEKQLLYLTHAKQKTNGRSYIVAKEGDTYATIAFSMNVKERTLRVWNDALGRTLHAGDRIYLSRKRCYGPKEKTEVWVHPGESLWQVCQREGVRVEKIQKLNGLDKSVRTFQTRQKILLRKEKEA